MKLSIFFEPLTEEYTTEDTDHKSVGAYIDRFTHTFPKWREADIAVFAINDNRGKGTDEEKQDYAGKIRAQLYALKKGNGRYKIADLGNLLPGIDLEDTYLRIKEVVEALISNDTIPIILGASHDLDYGQFLAYEHLEKTISMVAIDSRVDLSEDPDAAPNQKHMREILMHDPNYLFSFNQIGYQSYLVEPEMMALLEKLHFETYRIGEVHRDIQQIEPAIRTADLLSFDISAIRFQDAPAYAPANPFGLSGEEACQLCWYAGTNDNLSSFGIYEYNPETDTHQLAATTIATMIWYFIEGFYHRKNELDFTSKQFVKYAVSFHDNPEKMFFYKSRASEKWWIEVEPLGEGLSNRIVPCSYDDYLTATNGEVPNRWILTQQRLG